MNKILSILLACTAAGAAYGAQETAQETGQAAKNVAIDSVVVTGARYASDIRHLPMSVAVVDRDEIDRRQTESVCAGGTYYIRNGRRQYNSRNNCGS